MTSWSFSWQQHKKVSNNFSFWLDPLNDCNKGRPFWFTALWPAHAPIHEPKTHNTVYHQIINFNFYIIRQYIQTLYYVLAWICWAFGKHLSVTPYKTKTSLPSQDLITFNSWWDGECQKRRTFTFSMHNG